MKYISVIFLFLFSICIFAEEAPKEETQKVYTLAECISLAIDNNTDLKTARNEIITAVANSEIALSDYFPQISANHNAFETKMHNDSEFESGTSVSATLKVFDTGLRYITLQSAKKSEKKTKLNTFRKYQTVLYNVMTDYYRCLEYAELMELKKNSIKYYSDQEKEYKEKIALGEKAPVDIYSVQSSLANAKVTLLTATNLYEDSKRDLLNLMGIKDTTTIDLAKESIEVEPLQLDTEETIKMALDNRSDLLADKYAIESAEYNKKKADMGLWPLFYVNAEFSNDFKNENEKTGKHSDGSVMGYFSWNIFDGFNTQAKIKQSKVTLDNAKDAKDKLERDIVTNIKNLYTDIQISKEQLEASQIGFDSASKNRDVQTEKFKLNMNTNLDILNAQVQYDTAMANLITVTYDRKISYIELDYQTGMLGMDNELVTKIKK